MGAAVIGGLVASTALSLFVVPVIYTVFDDLEHGVKRRFAGLFGRAAQPVS
jgi:HAE1 family hydrophobic/amphiphilic exporter-1